MDYIMQVHSKPSLARSHVHSLCFTMWVHHCFRTLPARVPRNFQFLANTNSFSISVDLPTLNISYQWNHSACVCVFYLAFLN